MNRADYHPTARFPAKREFRNGWHTVDGKVTNLKIGDKVLLNGTWTEVTK